jgi:uncharacterized membrane protein
MRRVEVRLEPIPARFPSTPTTAISLERARSALFNIWTRIVLRPGTVFVLISLVFGAAVTIIVPPLRGPDEIAHFLRIYSYMRGEFLPAAEFNGRKGIFVERELHNQLHFFKTAGEWFAASEDGVRYGQIMAMYERIGNGGDGEEEADQDPVFMPFAGTEGYNPVAYIPYIVGGGIGRLLGLDFPNFLLLMRLFGLVTFTAITAYAIGVLPSLKWAFVLIALLPVSIYNRSVLSADGAALSSALVVSALCLGAARKLGGKGLWQRSLWMTLCALSKQPQIVFALLALLPYRLKELPRGWRSIAIVVLPSIFLSPLWVIAVSGEIAAWRLQMEEHHPPEQFDPLWKLRYMWEHPFDFPLATWNALSGWGDRLWVELIGVLGWQDILLAPFIYFLLTVLLLLVALQKMELPDAIRARVTIIAGLTVLSYVAVVYLIFYLTYTPVDLDHVRGVQGRYFVIVLPVAAIFIAGSTNLGLPPSASAVIGIAGSMISAIATVEALFHAHW